MEKSSINYKRIFQDILTEKFPNKIPECQSLLAKRKLSALDIITLNQIIFGTKTQENNQKFRSYKKNDILTILHYQKENNLSNIEVAAHFNLSRNTIAKWKKNSLV
jgi:DNA-binding transcriptional regulator YiaG